MKQYIIQFDFEGRNYQADVTEIDGLDDVQYAISPKDAKLAERYKTNIIIKDKPDNNWHYAFPSGAKGEEYMESLAMGLNLFIGKS
jgi:hypothetical protein